MAKKVVATLKTVTGKTIKIRNNKLTVKKTSKTINITIVITNKNRNRHVVKVTKLNLVIKLIKL